MRTQKYWPLVLLTGLLTAAPMAAQDVTGDTTDLYQVEVLLFRHLDQSRNTAEIPRLAEPEIEDVLDQQLARLAGSQQPANPKTFSDKTNKAPRFWQAVAPENLRLQTDASRLRNLQAYELITHLAWIQPAADVAVAEAVAVTDLDTSAPLSGTLKLYSKRYVHLAVDIQLDGADSNAGGFSQLLPVNQAGPAIVDSRRMRLGRTVYFDHPRFGILATVNKLEAE